MKNYLTTDEKVTANISIWAIPNESYDSNAEDSEPFKYELKEGMYHWKDEAIRVDTQEVTLQVPSGVNLVQQAISTLNKKKEKAREEYMDTCEKMDNLISQLTLITYQPEGEEDVRII